MKTTIHPDGRVEHEGTPAEIHEALGGTRNSAPICTCARRLLGGVEVVTFRQGCSVHCPPLHVGPPMGSTFIGNACAAAGWRPSTIGSVWVGTVKPTFSALNAAAAAPAGWVGNFQLNAGARS